MSTTGGRDRARRLAVMVGLVLLGLAVALAVLSQSQPRDPGPPEDVPRGLAIWAVYATVGLLAIIGAFQRRPAIVVAAGALCLAGLALGSVALIGFAVPGVVLILLGSQIQALPTRHWSEAVIAAAVVLLVVTAAIAPLVLAEGRCWQATRSAADPPTYIVTNVWSCSSQAVPAAGGQTFASGFESVLTTGGGLVEAVLLLGALTLSAVTGRTPTSAGVLPSIDQAPLL